jgi:trehalose-phosphatase
MSADKEKARKEVPPEYFFGKSPLKSKDEGTKILLLLDFDGTLVRIRRDPETCELSPEARDQLEALAGSGGCIVSVLSGRSLSDVETKVGLKGLFYGGNHGLTISGPGLSFIHPHAFTAKELICRLRGSLEKEMEGIEGVRIEDKGLSLTVHYRGAGTRDKSLVRRALYRTVSGAPERGLLTVLKGKEVLELMPNVEWDKGAAALFVLQTLGGRFLPVYVGDDLTDETAFERLRETGITIRVGPSGKTAARYYLKGQWEVLRLLREIREGLSACCPDGSGSGAGSGL